MGKKKNKKGRSDTYGPCFGPEVVFSESDWKNVEDAYAELTKLTLINRIRACQSEKEVKEFVLACSANKYDLESCKIVIEEQFPKYVSCLKIISMK